MADHTDIVARVKADLVARGVNISGACGALEITMRVAWILSEEGAGLLFKPDGENCRAYATGIVAYRDGSIVDMLGDAGGANIPQWNTDEPVDRERWRPPIDPGDAPPPPVPPPVPPIDPTPLGDWFLKFLDDMDAIVVALHDNNQTNMRLAAAVEALAKTGVKLHL